MTTLTDITPFLANSNWDHDGFWWGPFWLLWLVVIGTVIWLLARRTRQAPTGIDRAKDILAERYAKGEISRDEYRERLTELG
jgi:putative membrane protein